MIRTHNKNLIYDKSFDKSMVNFNSFLSIVYWKHVLNENSSSINEVIRSVLNFLFLSYDKISQVQISSFFYQCRLKVDLVL